METRAKKLLFDVLTSGRSIRQWCSGRTFADYEQDRQFRRAVEREFEIIGEALGRLPPPCYRGRGPARGDRQGVVRERQGRPLS